jgi:hypothetical protein
MKILKHLAYIVKAYALRIGCKHFETRSASCPFTGYTYVMCTKCTKYVDVSETQHG